MAISRSIHVSANDLFCSFETVDFPLFSLQGLCPCLECYIPSHLYSLPLNVCSFFRSHFRDSHPDNLFLISQSGLAALLLVLRTSYSVLAPLMCFLSHQLLCTPLDPLCTHIHAPHIHCHCFVIPMLTAERGALPLTGPVFHLPFFHG